MADVDTYDVFFSYSWRDQTAVEGVAQTLRQQGLRVFLDRWYLVPGRPWPQALEEVLASCRAVAVFVGSQGMGPWQQREKYLALSRQANEPQFPVIPVILPGADPALGFLSQNTWVDLRQRLDNPLSLEILRRAVGGDPPGPELRAQMQATLSSVCPYRGLRPFREEDAPFFFGRQVFVERLMQAVSCQALVALVGASGCGKSSVARAGLIPSMRRTGAGKVWETVTLLPGDRPLYALAAAFLPLLEPEMTEVERLVEVKKLADSMQKGLLSLRDVVDRVLDKQPGTDRLLLLADQWEELYTITREEEQRHRFLEQILKATQDSPLSLVLTLRGDFFGQILSYRDMADRLQGAVVNLGPMTRKELAQAVECPAAKVGLSFEPGLVERLLDDVGVEPGNLPLLEFALSGLWEHRQGGQFLHQVYEDMGRVQGAVAQQAEEIYNNLVPLEQQLVSRVFLELVRAGEGTEDTKRRATFQEVGEQARDIVKKLADARLVVTGRDDATGRETVEVSHEALIRQWKRLQEWLNDDRVFLVWRQRLRYNLEDWKRTGSDEGVLLRGAPLSEAQSWLEARPEHLSLEEKEFIKRSISLYERESQTETARRQRELEQAQALAEEVKQRAKVERRLQQELMHRIKLRQMSWFDYLLLTGLSIFFALMFNLYNDNALPLIQGLGGDPVKVISLDEAQKLYNEKKLTIIDARKEGFSRLEHIKGAENFQAVFFDLMFPMFQFKLEQKQVTKDSPIFVYGGTMSRRFDLDLARDLMAKNYENVMVLGSDYDAWNKAFPVVKQPAKAPAAMHLGLASLIEWLPLSIFVFMLIPAVRRSPYLSIFCRILLGVIFIQFALSKILRPAVFAMNVVDYQFMPSWGVNLWALILPWAELVAGLFLILGIRTRTAAIFIGAMNIIFIVALVNAILQGYPINCGCVGETGEPVNWWKVLKNIGMLLMAIQIIIYDRLFYLERGGFVWRESQESTEVI